MLELELISEKDMENSAKMYSDCKRNAFLLDQLLVADTASILKFCSFLQSTETQKDIGDMLVKGT